MLDKMARSIKTQAEVINSLPSREVVSKGPGLAIPEHSRMDSTLLAVAFMH